jgi:hypothetical protein
MAATISKLPVAMAQAPISTAAPAPDDAQII